MVRKMDGTKERDLIRWLLAGDIAIQYQVNRDLLNRDKPDLRKRIATEGWGARYLSKRRANGHWGKGFYQPKWISTHYTLLDLRHLNVDPDHPLIQDTINMIIEEKKGRDGGINPSQTIQVSDVCVNGMFLNYASYFNSAEAKIESVVDQILAQKMNDGGFNCRSNREGARHSSLHTTLSVLEGFTEYQKNGYRYRTDEVEKAIASSIEFILLHQLFLSDRTGEIINKAFLRLSYPARWFYNILRALDHFQYAGLKWDDRMQPAIDVLIKKRNKDGSWNLQANHSGKLHFEMEKVGKPSRWTTLLALRTLKHFGKLKSSETFSTRSSVEI
ncbi:MAG: hypothetical protein OEM26_03290 [Saprospiraceae bacterium]|nr:hypothetical protein [Saprospiraceae bacterium]